MSSPCVAGETRCGGASDYADVAGALAIQRVRSKPFWFLLSTSWKQAALPWVAMLADQAPRSSPERHWTQFLNQDTAFFMGAELLGRALRTQVLFVSMRRLERGRYAVDFEPINTPGEKVEQGAISERYARALERCIRNDPPGWLRSHRRWKLRRPAA